MRQRGDWTASKIGEYCLVGDGAHAKIPRQESGVMYLTSKNFKPEGLDLSKIDYISTHDFERHFRRSSKAVTMPELSDVLVSIIGSLGEPYVVRPSDRFGLSSSVAIIRPRQDMLSPEYLYYWMKGSIFQSAVYGTKGGVAQSYLSLEMIRSLPLQFPTLNVQRNIVEILSAYDELIDKNVRRIKILEEMAQMIYREWFVNFHFPGHEKIKMVELEMGPTPFDWSVKQLGDVLRLEYGRALKAEDRRSGTVPVFGSSGVVGFHTESLSDGPGIIVGRKGNVGSVFYCPFKFWVIDTAYYVRTSLSQYFLFFNLLTQNFLNNDAAVPGLNRNQAHSLPIIVPDATTMGRFDQLVAPMFSQQTVLKELNTNLAKTRNLVLPKLISGEVRIEQSESEAVARDI